MNIQQNFEPNATELALADAFARRRGELPGVADGRLAGLRDEAMASFARLGLPHRRIEAWHYTDLRRVLGEATAAAGGEAPGDLASHPALAAFAGLEPARLVFAGGRFLAGLSDLDGLGAGVEVRALSDGAVPDWALAEIAARRPEGDNAVFDLANALMSDGALIRVAAGQAPARPIEIVHLSAGGGAVLRHVVVVEPGASLCLAETSAGDGAMSLAATSIRLGDGARLDHAKIQDEGEATTHIAPMVAEIGAEARFNTFTLSLGAALAREERHVRFAGEGTEGSVSGAFLLSGRSHADTTLDVNHAAGGSESREIFRGIVDQRARSVVQNRVVVAPHAQKTDARQAVHVLLLSEEAEHDTKPELEIYADDVQCAHGATVGEIDASSLFYLMSRGIPRPAAEAMLIEAFLSGAMDEIGDEGLRAAVAAMAGRRLAERNAHG